MIHKHYVNKVCDEFVENFLDNMRNSNNSANLLSDQGQEDTIPNNIL